MKDDENRGKPRQSAAGSVRSVAVGDVVVAGFDSIEDCARHALMLGSTGRGAVAVAINAEKVIACRNSMAIRKMVEQASLCYPDGAGVVLAMRRKGVRSVRVPGADLWLEVLRQAGPGSRVALIGSRPEVIERTAARVRSMFPRLDIVLVRDGFGGADDPARLAGEVSAARPSLVLVAMGSPRQEQLIGVLMEDERPALYLGLGGSFDVFVGAKRRAPAWMQRAGLEWLFRVVSEPARLGRQTKLPLFAWLLLTGRI